MNCRTHCCKTFLFVFVLLALAILATPAFAQNTCLQNEYNLSQGLTATGTIGSSKVNCTANDVRIAQVTNIRDPLTGQTLSTCIEGSTFNFLADFEILTTSSQARENIGLYIATNSTTQALTGACVDNVIAPPHTSAGAACTPGTLGCFGSDNYHSTDPAPDNCGDTSSNDNSATFGAGAEKVTLEIDNFTCHAPAGQNNLVLPNCTSWQIPGGTIQCVTSPPTFPYPFNGPGNTPTAVPGTKSKCNCGIIQLPITPVTPTVIVQKACTTTQTPGPATFTQGPNTQSPTACNAGNGTTTETEPATYTVAVTNTTGTSAITVDQICDSAFGNIFTVSGFSGPACPAGTSSQTITTNGCGALSIPASGNTTATCSFTVSAQPELTTVTDTVSVMGHADINTTKTFGPSTSNSVSVTSTEVPTTATVTKGFVGTEAGCATVRYSVDVHNTSALDETAAVSALNDTPYGDITKCTNANCANNSGANGTVQILGTTCGVASNAVGLGTLSGSAGAGVLPVTLATGNGANSHYQCQFDGQFCSALDNNSCISNTDSVSATLAGDEGEAVTQTKNSLTVKECFQATVTSQ